MKTMTGLMLTGALTMTVAMAVSGCGRTDEASAVRATSRTDAATLAQAAQPAGAATDDGLDATAAQVIVRAVCDQQAVLTRLVEQTTYYEAAWGEAKVQWADGTLHPAPAKWARLAKTNPQPATTTCGTYNY